MRRPIPPLLAVAAAGLLTTCGESLGPIEDLPRELSIAEGKLIEADNRFAFKLFREINAQEGDKNIFISPLSIAMALMRICFDQSGGSALEKPGPFSFSLFYISDNLFALLGRH